MTRKGLLFDFDSPTIIKRRFSPLPRDFVHEVFPVPDVSLNTPTMQTL